MTTTFTYKLDHDLGFAPNPFFGTCTLACCKPVIRRMAKIGDYVVGMAGKTGLPSHFGRLIYWMKVDETMSFDEYWASPRFKLKKPKAVGPKFTLVGDNTYRRNPVTEEWEQEISMHYVPGSVVKKSPHLVTDTQTDRILLGRSYTYFGEMGPSLPVDLRERMFSQRAYQRNHSEQDIKILHSIMGEANPRGLLGNPIDFKNSRYFGTT